MADVRKAPTASDPVKPADARPPAEKSRREFMGFAFAAAASGLLMPELATDAEAQVSGALCTAQLNQELKDPGEIVSSNKMLQGLIDLTVENRSVTYVVPGPPLTCPSPVSGLAPPPGPVPNTNYICGFHKLRAYRGYRGFNLDPKNCVTPVGVAYPGPTLRASVGDTIELIFLNRIDPNQFNYSSQISMKPGACDTSVSVAPGGNQYPGTDQFPNCFHVSNTTNMHYHGTHTDPKAFGDNVLLGIMPNSKINTQTTIQLCKQAFTTWQNGQDPTKTLQAAAQTALTQLLAQANAAKQTDLAAQLTAAIANNKSNVAHGEWPQYWPGFYPYHFDLPVYSGNPATYPEMGQAPGSHWYHCHQHGSTTLQLLNGMAGALIITDMNPGGYDASILSLGGGTPTNPKIKEKVVLLQLFSEQPNRINQAAPGLTASPTATVTVNGQVVPKITMKQGEVQWWRVIDAAMKAHGVERFLIIDQTTYDGLLKSPCGFTGGGSSTGGPIPPYLPPPPIDQSKVPNLRQIAQDGVQFAWPNYYNYFTTIAKKNNYAFNIAPGNRMDFLVKAPAQNGTSYLVFWPPAGTPTMTGADLRQVVVLSIVVDGAPDANTNTQWFDSTDPKVPPSGYPVFPAYLSDIPEPNHSRTVTFSMQGGPGSQPQFFIDGKQFAEGRVDQTMMKDTIEEWKVVNTSGNSIMHPFHIHINPFQITEYYDPSDPTTNKDPLPTPWIWQDTKPIPAGGYFKMRTRFADFIGKYVLHCHILGHEDRGMMQLVQVVDNTTVVKHH
jgi:FtsP/CotA-like multicopper oxidase with cupredoxin domain